MIQLGDKFALTPREKGAMPCVVRVTAVSKTEATLGNSRIRLDRKTGDPVCPRPTDPIITVPSNDRETKIRHQQRRHMVENVNWKKMPDSIVLKVFDLLIKDKNQRGNCN